MRPLSHHPRSYPTLVLVKVTGMEGQVAFLAPLQPKLRQACKLGRMDRQRGDAFQKKLIEVRRRCWSRLIAQ